MPPPRILNLPRVLNAASRSTIQTSFGGLHGNFLNKLWLGAGNTFANDPVGQLTLTTHSNFTGSSVELADYIAASSPLHCADGWAYLARALTACLQGDEDTTRHLAYYASLRGAMSLLAAEGIGVFNYQHYLVEGGPTCRWIKNFRFGTHQAVWQLLIAWADKKSASNRLNAIINVGGHRIADWLDAFTPGASLSLIGRQWLHSWGLDLHRFAQDRNARNESSYRPTRLFLRSRLAARDLSDFLRDFWRVYQPSGITRFEELDRHLLRRSLDMAFERRHGCLPSQDRPLFETHVDMIFGTFSASGTSETNWKAFLSRETQAQDSRLLIEAEGTALPDQPSHHIQAIARAALLLRIATGAASQLIKDSGFSKQDLDFWWKDWGFASGFWQTGAEPNPLTDLWLDVDEALNAYEDPSSMEQACFPLWLKQEQTRNATSLNALAECERIALWALTP